MVFSLGRVLTICTSLQTTNQGQSSNNGEFDACWKQIWSLPCFNAVRNFMWRACTNSLPTKISLFTKKMVAAPICPTCLNEEETPGHVPWSCPTAIDVVWLLGHETLQKSSITNSKFVRIFQQLLTRLCVMNLTRFFFITRSFWYRRNTFIHEIYAPICLVLSCYLGFS